MVMGIVVALAGGVGAAKFLRGLVQVISPEDLIIIGNIGDDIELYGLHISPDLDIIMYTLAGIVDEGKGWGASGDTFNCLKMLGDLGFETWFKLGDKDLAIHIMRTKLLRGSATLSQATLELCGRLGVNVKLIPMSNDPVRTEVVSDKLHLEFQEYFVKRGMRDKVTNVFFRGAEKAKPAPGVVKAIRQAERVIVCPSNPILSISPILSIPAIKEELMKSKAYIVSISPIIGGKAIKGPADRIMADMELKASAYGVAKFYRDFLDHIIIDDVDKSQKKSIEELGIKVTVTDIVMRNLEDSIRLAKIVMGTK
jgi:LPPG:FO 2-phospho-L-lactate transferase